VSPSAGTVRQNSFITSKRNQNQSTMSPFLTRSIGCLSLNAEPAVHRTTNSAFVVIKQLSNRSPGCVIQSQNGLSWKGPSEAARCHSLQCTGTATAPVVLRAPSSLTLAVSNYRAFRFIDQTRRTKQQRRGVRRASFSSLQYEDKNISFPGFGQTHSFRAFFLSTLCLLRRLMGSSLPDL